MTIQEVFKKYLDCLAEKIGRFLVPKFRIIYINCLKFHNKRPFFFTAAEH